MTADEARLLAAQARRDADEIARNKPMDTIYSAIVAAADAGLFYTHFFSSELNVYQIERLQAAGYQVIDCLINTEVYIPNLMRYSVKW